MSVAAAVALAALALIAGLGLGLWVAGRALRSEVRDLLELLTALGEERTRLDTLRSELECGDDEEP